MRTLYVHVGPMKTGTSSVQSALKHHDCSIILYPKVGLWGPGSHHDLVYTYFGQSRRGLKHAVPVEQLFHEIARTAAATTVDLLISSERLCASIRSPKAQRDVKSFIEALLSALHEERWRVEILFTCREHFERAASTYSQQLKGTFSTETRDPDHFLRESTNSLLYAPVLNILKETGFTINVFNYHPACSWTERFLMHVGFPVERVPAAESRNMSLSPKALVAKLAANRVLRRDRDRREFTRCLQRMPGYLAPSQFIFGAQASADAEVEFIADRDFVRREFAVELPPPEPEYRENMFRITDKDLRQIADATEALGSAGQEIVHAASRFTQASPR